MLREGEVIGIMMEWDMTAIQKMEKVISPDGYMFYGKEEHIIAGSIWMAISKWAIWRGNSAFRARSLALCACKVWHRIL